MSVSVVLHWFRRDLRLEDNTALAAACQSGLPVVPVFIFDTSILSRLSPTDRRVCFLYDTVVDLQQRLKAQGSNLVVLHGDPVQEIPKLATALGAQAVFINRDTEPSAKVRDHSVQSALAQHGVRFEAFVDQVIFEGLQVTTALGNPFQVFTPYKNAWLRKRQDADLAPAATPQRAQLAPSTLISAPFDRLPTLAELGFQRVPLAIVPGHAGATQTLKQFIPKMSAYEATRDIPAYEGTSRIAPYLRFGLVSIRSLFRLAGKDKSLGAAKWESELIWREFYQMILAVCPYVATQTFKPAYRNLVWPGDEAHIDLWKQGQTGYPLVDAAMRCFAQTGLMHNRLRMVVASFLTKDLLIDYRIGEAYFAQNLLDFDLASNNGGWQWCASTGCDSQPYFRIFNPASQSLKFDPQGDFIRRFCPELKGFSNAAIHEPHKASPLEQRSACCMIGADYPSPIVNHTIQRARALRLFQVKGDSL